MSKNIDISIVIPIYNEEDSLPQLVNEILDAMRNSYDKFEIVLVNDGSTDKSVDVLSKLTQEIPEVLGVILRKNYGQTAAMAAGFNLSSGDVIVSLDGDLQK